ncbi:hypothetical protein [Staphylococcus epidermidis]|uniref:hypothetical protein n=1 Tax=Staphylococcus epidermidis TaxID=1282 RepID=UPI0037D9AF52
MRGGCVGRLVKDRGVKVTIEKLDGYLNVEGGRMSGYEDGEVLVREDGGESDLELGDYEGFIDTNLNKY